MKLKLLLLLVFAGSIFATSAQPLYHWAFNVGAHYAAGQEIQISPSGNVYVAGQYYSGPSDFDPGPGKASLSPTDGTIFIAAYDSLGNYLWAKNIGAGSSGELVQSFQLDSAGNILITGYFSGSADFDPSAGVYMLTSAGDDDVFFGKYDQNGNLIWVNRIGGTGTDHALRILSNNSNFFLCGFYQNTVDFDPGIG